jgi:hypothetical protein
MCAPPSWRLPCKSIMEWHFVSCVLGRGSERAAMRRACMRRRSKRAHQRKDACHSAVACRAQVEAPGVVEAQQVGVAVAEGVCPRRQRRGACVLQRLRQHTRMPSCLCEPPSAGFRSMHHTWQWLRTCSTALSHKDACNGRHWDQCAPHQVQGRIVGLVIAAPPVQGQPEERCAALRLCAGRLAQQRGRQQDAGRDDAPSPARPAGTMKD